MEKIKVIIIFEYMARVRRLSFLLTTILSPLLILLSLALPMLFLRGMGSGSRHCIILDQSGVPGLYESVKLKTEGPATSSSYTFSQVVVSPDQNIDQVRLKYNSEIENGSEKSYLVFRQGVLDGVSPEYYASSGGDFALEYLGEKISLAVIDKRLAGVGLDSERYLKPTTIKAIKVSPTGEAQGSNANIAACVMIFMITSLAILGYGSQVMGGVMEEKNTRIMEVMVSSAKPFEMMMGKLLGIGLVGLTQYLIWAVAAVPILFISQSVLAAKGVTLNSFPASTVLCFILYFLLGYFLFASMYLVGGVLVTDTETSNIVTRFMLIFSMLPFMTMLPVIINPSGTIAMVLSFIPFTASGIMVLRMGVSSLPLWQIIISVLLIVATTGATIWAAAKIYRIGMLIYGKKPNLVEIARWIRYA